MSGRFDILIENTFKGRIAVKDGYIRVAALTPKIKVGDCVFNGEQIKSLSAKHMHVIRP